MSMLNFTSLSTIITSNERDADISCCNRINRHTPVFIPSQIRAYPRNPRHPCSVRFDEYYFFNQKNHTHNPASSISCCHYLQDIPYPSSAPGSSPPMPAFIGAHSHNMSEFRNIINDKCHSFFHPQFQRFDFLCQGLRPSHHDAPGNPARGSAPGSNQGHARRGLHKKKSSGKFNPQISQIYAD